MSKLDNAKRRYLAGKPYQGIRTKYGVLWWGISKGDLVEILQGDRVGECHPVVNENRNYLEFAIPNPDFPGSQRWFYASQVRLTKPKTAPKTAATGVHE